MNFALVVVGSLFVGISGEVIPPEHQSSIAIPIQDLSAGWYLLYWGQPEEISIFPSTLKCLRCWGRAINQTYVSFNKVIIYKNGTHEPIYEDVTGNRLGDNKYVYKIIHNNKEYVLKVIDFNKYKYIAGLLFDNQGKKYLIVYGRDPYILEQCGNQLREWLKGTDNRNKPTFKIKPKDCVCAYKKEEL